MKCFNTAQLNGMVDHLGHPAMIPGGLDPDGVHVVDHHIAVGDNVKCTVLFKVREVGEGTPGFITLPASAFNALPEVEEVLAEAKEWEAYGVSDESG